MALNFEKEGNPLALLRSKTKPKVIPKLICIDEKDEAVNPFNEFKCNDDGELNLSVNPNTERQIIYITGKSGSGKSYFTKQYCEEYKKIFPKRMIYLFSSLAEDKTIDAIKDLKRITLNEDLLKEDITAKDFEDSMVIFDDTDCITDKKMKIKVNGILTSILETGRHYNTSIIFTSHIACAGNDTKRILNESHFCVFFPKNMGNKGLKYLLDSYYGLDKEEIKKVKKLKSRWVCICRTFPQVVLCQSSIYTLGDNDSDSE